MSNPIAGLFSAVGGSILGGALTATQGSVMNGPLGWANQASLRNSPFVLPPPEALVSLYYKGRLTQHAMDEWLYLHGIPRDPASTLTNRQQLWRRTIEEMAPLPDMETIRRAKLAGRLNLGAYYNLLDRYGLRREERTWLWTERFEGLSPEDTLNLFNRAAMTEAEARMMLKRTGIDQTADQDLFFKLRFVHPTPQDVITFAVKDVWQPDIVARFQYDAERPPALDYWAGKAGLAWKPSDLYADVPAGQDVPLHWLFWRQHWNLISPTQASQAVHFLRPAVPGGEQSRRPGIPAFKVSDFELILKTQDYPPIIRQWLYGLSFTPLTRVDIRRMYDLGVVSTGEVFELYRDIGYDEQNAARLRDFTIRLRQTSLTQPSRASIVSTAKKLYRLGYYTRGQAAAAIYLAQQLTPADQAAFSALPAAQQEATGLANPSIDLLLQTIDLEKAAEFAKKIIGAVRAAAIRSEITPDAAYQLLTNAGIKADDATRYIQLWDLEAHLKGHTASASQVVGWLKRGAITPDEARARLIRMNYTARDIAIMMALAGQDIVIAASKQREKLAASIKQVRREQLAQMKEMVANRNRIIADLNRSATKMQILRFLTHGYISPNETYAALLNRGVLPLDAIAFIQDAIGPDRLKYEDEIAKLLAQAKKDQDERNKAAAAANAMPAVPGGSNGSVSQVPGEVPGGGKLPAPVGDTGAGKTGSGSVILK